MRCFLALALGLLTAAPAMAGATPSKCVDAVVVAKVLHQEPTPMPESGPDEIIIRWPWVLTFEVEQTLAGRPDSDVITVVASMHTGFNPNIEHHLLLLRGGGHGPYQIVTHDYRVVSDRQDRFVVPLAGPVEQDWLAPEGWIPNDYQRRLKRIRYSVGSAWWLNEPYDTLEVVDPAWAEKRAGRVIAKRGLILEEFAPSWSSEICRR